ncbi:hypothetical protein AVEN_93392-1 [Araneus ventricosus]|uniref:Uncharacterized protein n=1 Tax=Araneus ventricosus TaxID=182803 RepID=A0A4Y2ARG6_ARAVE|nr:hypothetical protein AVEN_93392-1 [Araneus ventricosus]
MTRARAIQLLNEFFGIKYQPGEDVPMSDKDSGRWATRSRKSSAVPGGADEVPGDASGNKWYQKKDGKVFVKQNKTTKRSVKKNCPRFLCKKMAILRVCRKDGNKTPFEKYSGKKPSVSHLKPFGCLAYVGVPKQIRKKLDMRAKPGFMMSNALHTKGYRIWLGEENKLIETINVRFDENTKGIGASQNSNRYPKFNFTISDYSDDLDTVIDSLSGRLIPEASSESPSTSREEPSVSAVSSLIPCSEIKWIRKQGEKQLDPDKHPNGVDAMDRKINAMIESKVWDLVDPPANSKVLGTHWVYTLKRDENIKAVRFKARSVEQGNTQLKGESSDEVFSAVVNFSIVRLYCCKFFLRLFYSKFSICVCL